LSDSIGSRHKAAPPRGVWGHAPPENFEILGALRCILEAPEAVFIAAVQYHFDHHKPHNYYIKAIIIYARTTLCLRILSWYIAKKQSLTPEPS
jgi:hypothetical protein